MTADPSFQPIFGPNGAVMNAPSMTPEMRTKILEVAKPPTWHALLRELRAFVIWGVCTVAILNFGPVLFGLVQDSPWWSGVATGVVATMYVVILGSIVRHAGRRWEIAEPSGGGRRLQVPFWGRWTLAVTDVLTGAAYAALFAAMLLRPALDIDIPFIVAGLSAAFFAIISVGLRYLASQLRWVWRQPD